MQTQWWFSTEVGVSDRLQCGTGLLKALCSLEEVMEGRTSVVLEGSACMIEDALTQERKACPAIHHAFDQLEAVDMAFDDPVAPAQG